MLLRFPALLTGLFLCTQIAAQPTVTFSDYFIPIGGSWTDVQTENFSPGPAGEAVNWDFSNLIPANNVVRYTVLDPLATPFPDSFPTANYALFSPDTSSLEDEFYTYQYFLINENAGSIEAVGFANVIVSADTVRLANDTIFTIFDAPLTVGGTFPLQYQDSYTDESSFVSTVEFEFMGDTLVLSTLSRRTSTATVDGYGSLTTPAGVFPEVLRLRTVAVVRDSVIGFGFPIPPTERTEVNYQWLGAGEAAPLLTVDSIPVAGSGTLLQQTGFYRNSVEQPSNLTVLAPSTLNFFISPNPTVEQARLTFDLPQPARLQITLVDSQGRILRRYQQDFTAGPQTHALGLTRLPSGTYTVLLTSDTWRTHRRVIIR